MLHSEVVCELHHLESYASANQKCKRKAVGCSAIWISTGRRALSVHNGPACSEAECSGEKGNCGCLHAEVRLIIALLQEYENQKQFDMVCTYSPCTNCANAIIECGLFETVYFDIVTEHDQRGLQRLREAEIGAIEV